MDNSKTSGPDRVYSVAEKKANYNKSFEKARAESGNKKITKIEVTKSVSKSPLKPTVNVPNRQSSAKVNKFKPKALGKKSYAVSKTTQMKAISNLNLARGRFVQANGISSIFKPRFWILTISQFTLSNIYPLFITFVIAGIFLMCWFYGAVSALYALYFLKSIPIVVCNVILTIVNAVWFAFHGLTMLILNAVITVVNAIAYFFLQPFAEAIVRIIDWIEPGDTDIALATKQFMDNVLIKWPSDLFNTLQPGNALAYMIPEPVQFDSANKEFVWESLWSFKWVKPGISPYVAGEYAMVNAGKESIAQLLYPKINENAIADGIWASIESPEYTYDFTRVSDYLLSWGDLIGSLPNLIITGYKGFWSFLDSLFGSPLGGILGPHDTGYLPYIGGGGG